MGCSIDPAPVGRFAAVHLSSDALRAAFVPGLGMIGASLVHRGEQLLGQRGGLEAYARAGATMGIPLLHPWANRLDDFTYAVAGRRVRLPVDSPLLAREENGLPIHGLLAASPHWRAGPVVANGRCVRLRSELDFAAHGDLLAAFPFPHRLALDVLVAQATLTLRLTITATGSEPVPIAFGFHPYLRLPGVDRADWVVSLPPARHLQLDDRLLPTGSSRPARAWQGRLGDRTFDDAFSGLCPDAEFAVAGGGRRIAVRFLQGYPAAQVFAPPDDDVVCFEPMTAPTNALASGRELRLLAPGASFTAGFAIDVSAAPA